MLVCVRQIFLNHEIMTKDFFFYHKMNTDLLYQCVKYIARQVDISCFTIYVIHFEITEDLCDLIGSQKFDLIMDHASFL